MLSNFLGILYIILAVIQFGAIITGIEEVFGKIIGFIVAAIVAPLPIIGEICGVIGAVRNWGWSLLSAITLFLSLPICSFLYYFLHNNKNKYTKNNNDFKTLSNSYKNSENLDNYSNIYKKEINNNIAQEKEIILDSKKERKDNIKIPENSRSGEFEWLLIAITISVVITAMVFNIKAKNNEYQSSYVEIKQELNIRSGPGLSYDIVAMFHAGAIANVVAYSNNWIKVKYVINSKQYYGWINSKYTIKK